MGVLGVVGVVGVVGTADGELIMPLFVGKGLVCIGEDNLIGT